MGTCMIIRAQPISRFCRRYAGRKMDGFQKNQQFSAKFRENWQFFSTYLYTFQYFFNFFVFWPYFKLLFIDVSLTIINDKSSCATHTYCLAVAIALRFVIQQGNFNSVEAERSVSQTTALSASLF